jgi:MshEN domain
MIDKRLGMVLVNRGILTPDQVDRILAHQRSDPRPFGKLANELFNIPERDIWRAWADQEGHFCPRVDLACEPNDASVLNIITADEAVEHLLLPLRVEATQLVCATTSVDLPEAAILLRDRTQFAPRFVIVEQAQLLQYIHRRYGVPEPVDA